MATRKKKTTAIANYDEELAKLAEAAADQEAHTGGGKFFSLRAGNLSLDDAPLPDNRMAVVVIDSMLENVYYDSEYDPDDPQPPACYAFGRDDDSMAPSEEAASPQSDQCYGCPHNEWGSADRGRGKACRNRRRLALIPAGTIDRHGDFEPFEDKDHFEKAEVAYLAVPPTSIKGFGGYVKQTAATSKRPPFAVFTQVAVVSDPKTQFKVNFECLDPVPNELVPVLMERHKVQQDLTGFPYPKAEEKAEPTPKKGQKGKKTSRRKY